MSYDEINKSFSRLSLIYDLNKTSFYKMTANGYELGILGDAKSSLSYIFDLSVLN